jgi:hypothetical protein
VVVVEKEKALFISCPKTGTHSLYQTLTGKYGGKRVGHFHERQVPNRYRRFSKIGAVRHPIPRAISSYWQNFGETNGRKLHPGQRRIFAKACPGRSMDEFMDWILANELRAREIGAGNLRRGPEGPYFVLYLSCSTWYEGIPIDRFLKTESLAADFARLPLAKAERSLVHSNISLHRPPDRELLTDSVLQKILVWGAPDFQRFGYDPDLLDRPRPSDLPLRAGQVV